MFNDLYAEAFLMAAPGAFDAEQRAAEAAAGDMVSLGAAYWSYAVIRTRFFDDCLLDATARGIRQVVLLAAGLDTRAYRLRWPHGVRVYELDLPEVMGFKGEVLTERGPHRSVSARLFRSACGRTGPFGQGSSGAI